LAHIFRHCFGRLLSHERYYALLVSYCAEYVKSIAVENDYGEAGSLIRGVLRKDTPKCFGLAR